MFIILGLVGTIYGMCLDIGNNKKGKKNYKKFIKDNFVFGFSGSALLIILTLFTIPKIDNVVVERTEYISETFFDGEEITRMNYSDDGLKQRVYHEEEGEYYDVIMEVLNHNPDKIQVNDYEYSTKVEKIEKD